MALHMKSLKEYSMIFVNKILFQPMYFNDGTLRLKYNVEPTPIDSILWLYDNDKEMVQLWYLIKHIKNNKVDVQIDLYMPYIPNARMDRCQNNDEVFTLKYFADFINDLHLHQVFVFDPHSNVAAALINHLTIVNPKQNITLVKAMHPNTINFFCDEGAYKRYHPLLSDPCLFGVKERDWDSQKIHDLKIIGDENLIKGHDILICDDIVSRGSTLYYAATQLNNLGADHIYVYISHCEDTVLQPHINGKFSLLDFAFIDKIYTTNSIYREKHPKIEVICDFKGDFKW